MIVCHIRINHVCACYHPLAFLFARIPIVSIKNGIIFCTLYSANWLPLFVKQYRLISSNDIPKSLFSARKRV